MEQEDTTLMSYTLKYISLTDLDRRVTITEISVAYTLRFVSLTCDPVSSCKWCLFCFRAKENTYVCTFPKIEEVFFQIITTDKAKTSRGGGKVSVL